MTNETTWEEARQAVRALTKTLSLVEQQLAGQTPEIPEFMRDLFKSFDGK